MADLSGHNPHISKCVVMKQRQHVMWAIQVHKGVLFDVSLGITDHITIDVPVLNSANMARDKIMEICNVPGV